MMRKKMKVVWVVLASGSSGYGFPERVFKSQKKAMKYATSCNDCVEGDDPIYGAYPIMMDGDKK